MPIFVPLAFFGLGCIVEFSLNGVSRRLTTWKLFALGGVVGVLACGLVQGQGPGVFFSLAAFPLLFLTRTDALKDSIRYVTKWTAILLLLSFCTYLWMSVDKDVPYLFTWQPVSYYPFFRNYFFYIHNLSDSQITLFRFNGPFVEPGHLSMAAVWLLIATRVNLKSFYSWILIISILLSYSLAGYVLLALAVLFIKIRSFKSIVVIAFVCIVGAAYVGTLPDDSQFKVLIMERLEADKTKGIRGNNRSLEQTDNYYNNLTIEEFLGGMDWDKLEMKLARRTISGAGLKIFIITYGLVALLFYIWTYYCVAMESRDRIYAMSYFVIIVICILQRAYPQLFSWYYPFIAACFTAIPPRRKVLPPKPSPVPEGRQPFD